MRSVSRLLLKLEAEQANELQMSFAPGKQIEKAFFVSFVAATRSMRTLRQGRVQGHLSPPLTWVDPGSGTGAHRTPLVCWRGGLGVGVNSYTERVSSDSMHFNKDSDSEE